MSTNLWKYVATDTQVNDLQGSHDSIHTMNSSLGQKVTVQNNNTNGGGLSTV